ncbi:unnamed protein product [Mytilus coruscus]|uniref:Uncharacterized protein n=1 Tax=Mytilus coruscus TaxID=42192 RepID=A0A6J8EGA6_MYTCO|nr:unnamed protein product [Mytilus coruscus]
MLKPTCFNCGSYFYYSPKKITCFLKHLEGYRTLNLNTSVRQKCTKILKRACNTRWLSFEASIIAVMEDFIQLVHTLNKLTDRDAASFSVLKRMNAAHFVGLVFILHAVLPVLVNGLDLCSAQCDEVVNISVSNWLRTKNRRKLHSSVKYKVSGQEIQNKTVLIEAETQTDPKCELTFNEPESDGDDVPVDDDDYDKQVENTLLQIKIVRSMEEA